MNPVYLDNKPTTPVDPRVLEAVLPYFRGSFGNLASRKHGYGWGAERAIRAAIADVQAKTEQVESSFVRRENAAGLGIQKSFCQGT